MNKEELSKHIVDYFATYDDKENYLSKSHRKITVEFTEDTSLLGNKTETCHVRLEKMYRGLGNWAGYENLKWLASVLGTDHIDLKGEYYRAGCDTCDYGSQHTVTIVCKDIKFE